MKLPRRGRKQEVERQLLRLERQLLRLLTATAIAFGGFVGAGIGVPTAAAAPPLLWSSCDVDEPVGQRCNLPRGVAVDAENGHAFVSDQNNRRIVEFDALGFFVKAWGWDVVQGGGLGLEVCIPDQGDVCKPGLEGSGVGQFSSAPGVAVDSVGNVYVTDRGLLVNPSLRVQKFSPTGQFILMFGGQVNKTKTEIPGSTEAERNVCTAASGDVCQKGTKGTGQGQFGEWGIGDFITVEDKGTSTDSDDLVYVGDQKRIQRFNSGGVYQGECALPLPEKKVQSLDVDSSGNLYATYEDQLDVRKLTFVAGGACQESMRFEIPKLGVFGEFATIPTAVAVDGSGHVYAFCCPNRRSGSPLNEDPIFEFDPAGNVVDQFGKEEFNASTGLATNLCSGSEAPGNVYVTAFGSASSTFVRSYGTKPIGCFKVLTRPATNIAETAATLNGTVNPDGAPISECRFEWGTTRAYGNVAPCVESPAQIGTGTEPVPVHADISNLQGGTVYHFRLRARVGGETENGPDEEFKTLGPPAIDDEHLVAASDKEAVLKALVNPEGFATRCMVEYGTTPSYGQSTPEVDVDSDRTQHVASAVLEGLQPATTYHWRFVCKNGAVLDGGVTKGEDHTLTTYRPFAAETGCPNQTLRGGASAFLPDCRAYEMVSPVAKNGADIVGRASGGSLLIVQADPEGEKLAYGTQSPAFGEDPPNSFSINEYLAERRGRGEPGEGWSSVGIHPPYLGHRVPGTVPGGPFREFVAFTPDLCSAWVVDAQMPPLNPDGQEEALNLYRRQNCEPGKGSFETVTSTPPPLPPDAIPASYIDSRAVEGFSDDGRHAVFAARANLLPDEAAPGTAQQLYDRFGGSLHLVSVLPGGVANPTNASVGSGWQFSLENAVSTDGSLVYWTAGISNGKGKLYVRLHPEQGIVASECATVNTACTIPVSAGTGAFFWSAKPNGSAALYSEGDLEASTADLYRFDLATQTSQPVVQDIMGVAGASQDLSRVYFVSRAALPGSGENGEGDEALAGRPNLYLVEGGNTAFIATLVEGDVGAKDTGAVGLAYTLINFRPNLTGPATRVTPDGMQIAFQSQAPLMRDFDNTAAADEPAVEVYTYRVGGELICVSCNPSGARPAVRNLPEPYFRPDRARPTGVVAAAWIPTWEHPHHASNVLSADGSRLFFNANDALLPRDTNGTQDVYEWEALGAGSCEAHDPSYFPQNDGCLYLISSGQNPFESNFWEASPDGEDVFFTTAAGLLPQDPGSIDLYDARVGGGFPLAPSPPECEGEACQSPPPPPEFGEPASGAYQGPGNQAKKTRRPCPKGKRRVRKGGKVRCVPRKGKLRSHRANRKPRARQ